MQIKEAKHVLKELAFDSKSTFYCVGGLRLYITGFIGCVLCYHLLLMDRSHYCVSIYTHAYVILLASQ